MCLFCLFCVFLWQIVEGLVLNDRQVITAITLITQWGILGGHNMFWSKIILNVENKVNLNGVWSPNMNLSKYAIVEKMCFFSIFYNEDDLL